MSEGNTANDIIVNVESGEEEIVKQPNTLQDTVKELFKNLFKEYKEKTSVLSYENIDGMVQVDTLNEYMEINFGYKYKALEKLVETKCIRIVSKDGFGIASGIEIIKSIQATFENHQIPDTQKGLFQRR